MYREAAELIKHPLFASSSHSLLVANRVSQTWTLYMESYQHTQLSFTAYGNGSSADTSMVAHRARICLWAQEHSRPGSGAIGIYTRDIGFFRSMYRHYQHDVWQSRGYEILITTFMLFRFTQILEGEQFAHRTNYDHTLRRQCLWMDHKRSLAGTSCSVAERNILLEESSAKGVLAYVAACRRLAGCKITAL